MSISYSPHGYQKTITRFILDHPKANVWADMGLGKTVSTLTAIVDLFDAAQLHGVLIVSTLRVIKEVWPQEIAKWNHTKHLTYSIIHGGEKKQVEALHTNAHIYLINYEGLPWLTRWKSAKNSWLWNMVVYDESSKMKNASVMRFKLWKQYVGDFTRAYNLTGTPAPKGYLGLWSQNYLLDQGERLGSFITHFEDRHFVPVAKSRFQTRIRHGSKKRIQRRISDITISLKAEDYINMPKLIVNDIKFELPKRKKYDELHKELVTYVSRKTLSAMNKLARMNKCRQFTSGAVYHDVEPEDEHKKKSWTPIHTAKIDILEEIIGEAQEQPVLVVYEFKHELERIRQRWPKTPWIGGGWKGPSPVPAWNRGEISLLAIHSMSAAHGLNLQGGGHIMVFLTLPVSLELYLQVIKRIHRQGQSHPVIVHRLLAARTTDVVDLRRLEGYYTSQSALLAALKGVTRGKIAS